MGRPAKDYTGKKINKWTVIEKLDSKEVHGKIQPTWLCRCECGTEKILSSGQLGKGSGGCIECAWKDRSHAYTEDLTGQQFAELAVLEYSHANQGAWWKCRCSCGTERVVSAGALKRGDVKSCKQCKYTKQAHSARKDETGNTYGELTVVEFAGSRGKEAYWLCECSCGNATEVRGSHLRGGTIQRCRACGAKETAKANTTHGLTHTPGYKTMIARRRKHRAKALDNWTPEMEAALKELFPYCVLCGMTEEEHQRIYGTSLHVDHVRPLSRGHGLEPGNTVCLCAKCNRAKHAKPLSDLPLETQHVLLTAAQVFNEYYTAVKYIGE